MGFIPNPFIIKMTNTKRIFNIKTNELDLIEEDSDDQKTHKCLANMKEHKIKECPSLKNFKEIF